ncbi:SDR family NAD(P)-dependent oxidoreductase, partial [Psychroserpens damuponensis]|uniref:SDR family NAD(P)-dependent oxidoreductase n=1 Tax=Psychroserpens damuponensis TaxID=943936 RepID=UPI00058D79F6
MTQSKNIIITGTSRGIGFELVHLFANQGHNVLALSRNAQPVSNLHFDNIASFAFDLCKEADYLKVEDFIKN